jgi:hypothetical protein
MLKPSPAALTVTAALLLSASSAQAQLPQARLQSLSRLGMRAGDTVDVTLRGTDLEGVNQLWFNHPGLRAFHLKGQSFRVACAGSTPAGYYDLRAVGTYGVSNPRAFVVGDRTEAVEAEPNDVPAKANPIALNMTINGEFVAADVDCYAFEGKKGQRVFLDVTGERLDSKANATLHVLDPDGREIAENRDFFGGDPFLDLTLPADGRYVVKVHDVVYGGSTDHGYRLTFHDGPHLDAIVPVVAAPGVPTRFTLLGRNLGGPVAPDLTVEGRPLERKEVTLTPPDEREPTGRSLGLVLSPAAPRRGFEHALKGQAGSSNPVFVGQAADPVVIEKEPNDGDGQAQTVTPPCDVSGTFAAPNDMDVYRFKAKKGEVWWVEASAERLGSAADPVFLIQKVVPKGPPQDLVTGEDQPDPGAGARFAMATVDAQVRWQVPDDGEYQVVVNDLYSSQRGDPRLSYRLNIRRERPDFALFIVPESANQPDGVTLRAGGRAAAYLVAWRFDGFGGPIRVEALDMPPGVSCDPVDIRAGVSVAPVVFEASEDAKPHVGPARLVGRARFGDRKDGLRYVPGATALGPDVAHEALAGGMVWPPLNPAAPGVAPARVNRGFVVTVREPAPLSLSAKPSTWVVAQGHQLPVDVAVTRRAGFVEAVSVSETDLPPNVPAVAATVAKNAATATVPLFVPKNVPPGTYTFLLRGTGAYPFSKDPNAKPKPNVNLNEPSNPVTVVVRPAPVSLAVDNKGGALKQGARLEVGVTVTRQNGFTGAVTLTLAAPPALKLAADPVEVDAGQTAAKLVLRAAADSPAGAAAQVAVRATGTVNGGPVEVDEPVALTINK